ncbi:MAG: hypothetical protein KJN89_10835 [Gammaproteobacteria bacterium]|nr:hypothetical protein [Gammaproteobacteria bacterium]MBT8134909.1 hypothetical protein [Gammaproteobacteria bacterium]NNJ50863.1 hypothetical protein [Gammaproteobacteria bacterium]
MTTKLRNIIPVMLVAFFLSFDLAAKPNTENSKQTLEVYQLSYIEREPGTDEYEVTMLVSDRYIRIDEAGEESGYIIYDDKDKVIYSVAHHDKSILVIKEKAFSEDDSPVKAQVEYLELADAPNVSGKAIYNYRVFVKKDKRTEEETCTEIQLVEGLLPEVRGILQNYQKVVSGQQVNMVDNKISEFQDACFYADQVYNNGAYYEKGLPIQEWHSNDRSRILITYDKISIDPAKFKYPESYRQFSIDRESRLPMP